MHLRDLRYFLEIAECGHLGNAATRLHRTQPALSGCIRRLEEYYGAQLVVPDGRGIKLTEAGQALVNWASRLLCNDADARRHLGLISQGLAGTVRLGVIPAAAHMVLPEVTRRAGRELPHVSLFAQIGTGEELVRLLDDGEIDLAVMTERRLPFTIQSLPIGSDRIVVVASSDHPLLSDVSAACSLNSSDSKRVSTSIRPQDLLNFPWILQPRGAPTREWLEARLLALGLKSPSVHLECNMLPMLSSLIAGTELLGFASSHYDGATNAQGTLVQINAPELEMRRTTHIATRKDTFLSPAVAQLRNYFIEAARRLYLPLNEPRQADN